MAKDMPTGSVGGRLKLKGDAGIDKKRKKKKKDKKADHPDEEKLFEEKNEKSRAETDADADDAEVTNAHAKSDNQDTSMEASLSSGKTETERRFEEVQRRRLLERAKKEGVKTHKQRVEEFNKALAAQSEHHDMPRIGPG